LKTNPKTTITYEEWKKNNSTPSYNFEHGDDYVDEISDWDVTLMDGLDGEFSDDV
jgi:hypothetical protein